MISSGKEIMYNLEVFINDFHDFLENDKRKINLPKIANKNKILINIIWCLV